MRNCDEDASGLGRFFLLGYSRIGVIGETGLYDDCWRSCALDIAVRTQQKVDIDDDDEADIYCDPFEEKYRWMLGLQDITTSVKNTEGVDLLVLNAEDYFVKGLLWDALTMPTKVRKPLVELTYRKLTKDAGVPVRMREPLGKILASTPPLTRPVIPRKLIAIIGTLVYPENIASAGKWSGYSRELTKLASLYDWVRESPVPSDSARRTLRREYRSMVDSDAPDWVFEYLKT